MREENPAAPATDWNELASLPTLASVLDPSDLRGGKNRLIDRAQRRAILRRAGNLRGRRVLDFGCGSGRLARWLVAEGATVHGVDPAAKMVEAARRNAPSADFDILEDPAALRPAEYDAVVCVGVLYLFSTDQQTLHETLSHFARVLKPDGRVFAVEKVSDGQNGRAAPLPAYRQAFEDAKLVLERVEIVRLGFSSVLGLAQRRPLIAKLPFAPRLLELEARRHAAESYSGGQYADYLFVAHVPER